jgi:predicted PhzF superfamily epimerase YddE/YHI9
MRKISLQPNRRAIDAVFGGGLTALSRKVGVDTVAVIATEGPAPRVNVRVRDLCPGIENPEKSAFGTTNGAVACYLVHHWDVNSHEPTIEFRAEQGVEMGRPSVIETSIDVMPDGLIEGVRRPRTSRRVVGGFYQSALTPLSACELAAVP